RLHLFPSRQSKRDRKHPAEETPDSGLCTAAVLVYIDRSLWGCGDVAITCTPRSHANKPRCKTWSSLTSTLQAVWNAKVNFRFCRTYAYACAHIVGLEAGKRRKLRTHGRNSAPI
ncbi:unnamed protein product, partial [Ectocarpus fasciculatus]